jgi:hypothetical protein
MGDEQRIGVGDDSVGFFVADHRASSPLARRRLVGEVGLEPTKA